MAWIESHQSLSRHRKTLRAAAILRVSRHLLIGHLHELWWWALDNVPANGFLGDLTDAEIAQGAEWPGDPTEFVRALTEAGFIDETENGRYLHDWHDYAGGMLEKRAKDAERKREERRRKSTGDPSDVRRTSDGHPTDVQAYRTVPNQTQPSPSFHPDDSRTRARETESVDGSKAVADPDGDPEGRWAVATAMATRFEPADVLDRLRRCRVQRIADGALVVEPPADPAVMADLQRLRPKLQAALRIDKRAALNLIILEPEYDARAGPDNDWMFQRSDTG
ncbi:hypothetical protein [Symbiobacterium terraclitae]|uniref:hypothetical protein n=1 Tax=Symbiobacterium terraclitae TaxID=557451 RepID=UPI0035B5555F